jgi:Holliday junction resolvasome RuvABC endonuclease subunit
MDTKTKTILGINQGTRYLGLAVISGTMLRDWKVKTLKNKWSQAKLRKALRIVKTLIDQYQPTAIAIKRLNSYRSSQSLRMLTLNICKIARIKHVKAFEFSISDLKRHYSGEESICNKKQLAEVLASQYPDLYFELEKEKKNRNPYYMRMFEAVALAVLLSDKSFNS